MKNAVFWDVAPCRAYVNRRFGGIYRLHLQGRKIRERGTNVSRWLRLHTIFTYDPSSNVTDKQQSCFFSINNFPEAREIYDRI
jgi:hypothetical protein